MDPLPYEEVLMEEIEAEVDVIDAKEIAEETKTDNVKIQNKIELEITNEMTKDEDTNSSEDSNDEYTSGQITLEL